MRRHRTVVSGVSLAGVVLLLLFEAFSQQISSVLKIDEADRIRLEIGLAVAFIVIVMNLVFHLSSMQSAEMESHVNDLQDRLANLAGSQEGRISLLTSEQLYRELRVSAEASRNRIYTTYMGERPPDMGATSSKRRYFAAMLELPKKRSNVTVRRLVRVTDENAKWVDELVRKYVGLKNVSVALIRLPESAPVPLSVQLYDGAKTYLVRVTNRPPGQARDIAIASENVVGVLDGYYEAIWAVSSLVLDSGVLNDSVLAASLNAPSQ